MKTATAVDYVVIAVYMALMLGIGVYSARFNRGASDYFKGGNRIPWLVAGLSSFMSGFSAWTFTGAAGLAYQKGVVAILLYVGNAATFLLGYFVFAVRWRRARISTVMEYLAERFDERTRQAFSWTTVFFQLFTGASMLYGLGLFVASTSGLPLTWTIVGCGAVILAYCVVGGLWAVVITDFLQAVILMPFTLVMLVASLSRVGGLGGLLAGLPPEMKSLAHPAEGWVYVVSWTVMVSFGYNTAAMAQRYFSVDDERSAKKVALLCFGLFLVGSVVWFVPPLAMRILYPDLRAVWPGLANAHEASYAVAALTLLPTGLVGIMLAAMFSATMSSLSGLFNMHAAVISKDIYQTLFARKAGERELLIVGWIATFGVGAAITGLAAAMAARGASIFGTMLTFNTVMSLAYGPPALLGLVVRRTPRGSGLASFGTGLILGSYGAFFGQWSLVQNVVIIIPASVAAFFVTGLFERGDAAHAARRDALFQRLDTPVDVARELHASPDRTAAVFRFLARMTAAIGLASLVLIAYAGPGDRATVLVYVGLTLAIAVALAFVRGAPSEKERKGSVAAATAIFFGLLPAPAEAGVAAVWAVNDGEKVERDDLAHPAKARNSAWDGRTVRLFGAGNEVLAFQLIVEGDAKGIAALSASLPELRRQGGSERIAYAPPAADPANTTGRPIQLFSVNYMNVTEPTHADWAWAPGSPAAPKDPTGWKPVQLVPENARAGRGGFPLKVAPRHNQAIWVEVYTGRGRPPGTYAGVLTVKADGQARTVPVELELMAFTLPDENSMEAMVYYEADQPERYQGRNLDDAYHRFAHRHRVELVHAYDQASVRAHSGRFDGADFTRGRGYEGPGEGVGNRIVPVSFYGPGRGWEDRATAWARADAWMGFLGSVLPRAITFLYMPDEPRRAQFPEILTLAGNVHSNPGPGRRLPIFVTRSWVEELDGAIDMWSTGPQHFDIARAAQERARGHYYWTYNGGRPAAGAITIDTPATDPRATIWACFKHGIEVYFYWHGDHWRHNSQKQGERDQDVWANPITFDNRGQPNKEDFGTLNGDGVLFYPGEEKLHPAQDRGVAGPVSTVQLANFRRGLQDHQYLTLARKMGLDEVVDAALAAVVPRVFSDAKDTVGFAETGDAYEATRRKVANAIVARGAATASAPTPGAGKAGTPAHPRLLVAERDPFSGLPALRARWAAGERPPDDLAGWALAYLLSGDESYARRAVDELRRARPAGKGSSSLYLDTLKFALAFDWLYGYPGFDDALKDRLAKDLVDGAERELANPLLADPEQVAYHNHFVRYLSRAAIGLWAVEGHPSVEGRAAPMREKVRRSLDNVLDSADMVTPDGGYHESMDYMRITYAPLAILAEMRRTMGAGDPAHRHPVFAHMGGDTYLYKVEPDGTTSRDDDNEWPHLQALDNVVLGYAIHRFKDPFAAWIQRESGWVPKEWTAPILQFLWSDPSVTPRDPARTTETELPRAKLFRGIGHFVMRDGWGPDSTWIEFDAGPFFAKHDHLDQGHFMIHYRGDLAIDSGADYTDTESPHYLNYYRRTVAHNSMLVYKPGETFFWGENLLPAANDGGQRMDSSRYWNTVRSREDFRRTRDVWDVARMEAAVHVPGAFDYARADLTRAYHPSKMERFTRELVYAPGDRVLFVFDRVRAADPALRKAWLLHGVNEPKVEGSVFTFEEGQGRLRVHSLLPAGGTIVSRGGPGQEFWTPGDEKGGAWGSGRNWPLIPFEGAPLPDDPELLHMWKTFWGTDLERILPSNARSVVPGGWRIEVTPARPAREDHFLHVMEIGDAGETRARRVERVAGKGLEGAVVEGGTLALFDAEDERLAEGEVTLPDVAAKTLVLSGLAPLARYDIQLTPNSNPGAPMWRQAVEADESGLVHLAWDGRRNARLRLRAMAGERSGIHSREASGGSGGCATSTPQLRQGGGSAMKKLLWAAALAASLPPITKPILFDTPEADRIVQAMRIFPPDSAWNEDISALPKLANSDAMIASIGADKPLGFNLDMNYVIVPPDQKKVAVKVIEYPAESDPGPFPVPENAPIENWPLQKNEDTKALPKPGESLDDIQRHGTGDRHLILVDPVHGLLHEFWQARKTDAGWEASQASTFDLDSNKMRPERWTSSDAAGLPVFPAIARYDEIAKGLVRHAMRFTVRRTRRAYVYPARHWASKLDDPNLPRMGERFRLRRDFDVSGFPPHAQAILKGLQTYGMFMADNGSDWLMSVAPDRRLDLKGLETLSRVKGRDFEVVQTTGPDEGPRKR